MSKLATVVAIVALSACATRTGKVAGVVAGTSTALGIASFAAASKCDPASGDCVLMNELGGMMLLGVAGAALLTAAIAEARHRATTPVERPLIVRASAPAPADAPRKPTSPAVVELMVSASVEASVGRCVTVRALATRVNELDPEFYTTVFRVDPAIQRCD